MKKIFFHKHPRKGLLLELNEKSLRTIESSHQNSFDEKSIKSTFNQVSCSKRGALDCTHKAFNNKSDFDPDFHGLADEDDDGSIDISFSLDRDCLLAKYINDHAPIPE